MLSVPAEESQKGTSVVNCVEEDERLYVYDTELGGET